MNDICAIWPIGIDRSVPAIVKAPSAKKRCRPVSASMKMGGKALAAVDDLVGRGRANALPPIIMLREA